MLRRLRGMRRFDLAAIQLELSYIIEHIISNVIPVIQKHFSNFHTFTDKQESRAKQLMMIAPNFLAR